MKHIYIFVCLFLLTSCFGNNTSEFTLNEPSKKTDQRKEIPNVQKIQTVHTGIILTGTQINTMGTSETTQKELEFTITPFSEQKMQAEISDDASITKYVNDTIHYNQINYLPDDLELIISQYILDTKGNQTLRKEANLYLQELAKAFYEEFGVPFKIVSAYRSYNYQVGIKQRGCSDLFCAKAGYSEHQSGLAFDMFEATSQEEFLSKKNLKKYFEWMTQNAHKYGFHNSYQKGKQIDGYAIEPWHWRYLGIDFATELKQKKMTYGEYYKQFGQK